MGRFCRRFRRFRRPPSLPSNRPARADLPTAGSLVRAACERRSATTLFQECTRSTASCALWRRTLCSDSTGATLVERLDWPHLSHATPASCAAATRLLPRGRKTLCSDGSAGATLVRRRLDCCRVGAKPCAAAARRARPWCSDDSAAAATLGERLDWRSPCRATRRPRASAGSLASGMSRGLPRRGGTDCVEGRANLVPGQQTCGSKPTGSGSRVPRPPLLCGWVGVRREEGGRLLRADTGSVNHVRAFLGFDWAAWLLVRSEKRGQPLRPKEHPDEIPAASALCLHVQLGLETGRLCTLDDLIPGQGGRDAGAPVQSLAESPVLRAARCAADRPCARTRSL